MIQIDDRDFVAAYEALMERWSKNAHAGVRRYAEAAAEAARRHVHSVSGELAGSIGVVELEDGSVEVGAFETGPDPHGLYVEFGTSTQSPRPFMRPALEEARGDFKVDP